MENTRALELIREADVQGCEYRDERKLATVTLKDGSVHQVAFEQSRRYPHGVYRDASGRIFLIG